MAMDWLILSRFMGTRTLFEFHTIEARRRVIPQTNYSIAIIPCIHEVTVLPLHVFTREGASTARHQSPSATRSRIHCTKALIFGTSAACSAWAMKCRPLLATGWSQATTSLPSLNSSATR